LSNEAESGIGRCAVQLTRSSQADPPSLTIQASWLLFAKFLVVTTSQSVLALGFGMSAFYFIPREAGRRPQVVFNICLLNLLMGSVGLFTFLLYPRFLVLIFHSEALMPYARWIGLVILLTLFSSFLEIIATAHQEVRISATFIALAQLTKSLFMGVVAIWFPSVRALLFAATLQCLTQNTILIWYLRSRFPGFWRAWDWGLFRTQVSYAAPFGLATILALAQTDLHSYFVSSVYGPAAFAVYAIGCFQLPVLGLLRESVGAVTIPRVSALQQQGEHREILLLTFRIIRKMSAVYLPAYAFLMISGHDFLAALFTKRYLESWPVFAVNLTMLPLALIVIDPVVRAFAEYRYFILGLRVVLAVLMVPGLWLGIRTFGMPGAIGTVVAANLIERLTVSWRISGALGFRFADLRHLRDVGKLAGVCVGAALLVAVSRALLAPEKPLVALTLAAFVFGLAYVAGVLALRVPTPEERAQFWLQWQRLRGAFARVQAR
jgi:O-antigen/teichoic acid export membrane protein